MKRIEVDGLSTAYHRLGAGPPVVFVHGYVGDAWSTWRPQLESLSDEFTVVACDLPGAGASADPPEEFGITGYADFLARSVHPKPERARSSNRHRSFSELWTTSRF